MLPHAAHHLQHTPSSFLFSNTQSVAPRALNSSAPSHVLLAHTPAGTLSSCNCSSSRSSRRRAPSHPCPPPAYFLSSFVTSAASPWSDAEVADASPQGPGVAAIVSKPSSALAVVQQAGIQIPQYCCGCGVKLQQVDPEGSGYFVIPSRLLELAEEVLQSGSRGHGLDADVARMGAGSEDPLQAEYEDAVLGLAGSRRRRGGHRGLGSGRGEDEDSFPGMQDEDDESARVPDILCQRCFSLKHTGAVKVQAAEESLPDFDLGKKVGRKIFLQKDRRAVVLMVVDASDFDGSLPVDAVRSLLPPGYTPPPYTPSSGAGGISKRSQREAEEEAGPLKFRLMVALNKVDLLPKEATQTRLVTWVRGRMAAAGLPRPDKVFCVSAPKAVNVRPVVEDIRAALGFRGDLWVVGAQNVGKSSLIAALKRLAGTGGQREPTVAAMPGTTLGLINVPGLPLGPKHRAFDTPGVPHRHQLTTHLAREDVKQVLPHKPLVPRTYRVPAGSTLLMGGLARLDVLEHPGATLYLTAWMSSYVTLHMGKTEGAEERLARHAGSQLVPPSSPEAWQELPPTRPRHVVVEGTAWDHSTMDIHIAGLGWVAVGVKGVARFAVHTHPDVAITSRPALLPDYARDFQRPGFCNLLPKGAKKQQQQRQQQPPKHLKKQKSRA